MSIFVDLQVDGDAQNDATTDLWREKQEGTSGEREEHQIEQGREHQDAEVLDPEVPSHQERFCSDVQLHHWRWSPIQANDNAIANI